MGLSRLAEIARRLIAGGMAAETRLALLFEATLPGQRVIETTLAAARDDPPQGGTAPALVVIGAIVGLRDALKAHLIVR
jgi:uroporphyrin-III C-methyltransferase